MSYHNNRFQRKIQFKQFQQLQYAQCEPRQLLASIVLNGTELVFGGDPEDNIALVSISGDEVTAAMSGVETVSFPVDDVLAIRFVGLGGDDNFTNETSIPSFAFGHAGNDFLIGGTGNDRLVGGTGDDLLVGGEGDDEIRGGAGGTKEINGGAGDDRLFGGSELNTIRGGTGDDTIYGSNLADMVFGGEGDDLLFPGHGDNVVYGGKGSDTVIAGIDNDTIFGEEGNDRLYAGAGDDVVDGGDGNDSVIGRVGNDILRGGDGNDYMRGNDGDDLLEGQAGNDVMQGDRGDDRLVGGSNTSDGFDRVLLGGDFGRYRIAGDLISSDRIGDDGFDELDEMEWIHYIGANPHSHAAESQIRETVTVQPIIAANDNGSNQAEFFGTEDEERLIKRYINDIYYQARIEVNWLAPNNWDNTFANVGNTETRPFDDAFEIFDLGDRDGVANSNSTNLNMFFIEIVPGGSNLAENTTNGLSLDGDNGVTFQVGDLLPGFDEGRKAIARVAAHELAHNLGLDHVSSPANLMHIPEITGTLLNDAQISQLIASRYSR